MKYYNKEMTTIHPEGCTAMTWEDAEAVERTNYHNGWAISMPDCLRMLADHMDAEIEREETADQEKFMKALRTIEMIEWRLEDANFHTFSKLLHDIKYDSALTWIKENYQYDMEVK